MLWMLVILKSFSGPTIFLAFWTCVGEQVWKMFCLHMQGDTGLSTVCECKAQSTRITSVFIPCHKLAKILRGSNILKNKHNLENSCKLLTILTEQHHIPSQYTPQIIIAIFSNHPLFQSIVTATMIYQNLWYLSLCLVRVLFVLRTTSQNWHW